MKRIYINAAEQISCQSPLSKEWFSAPLVWQEKYVRSVDPNFREYFAPLAARKMGKLLKRAIVTSQTAIEYSGIEMPDAIITGTGLGCVENTEAFLTALTTQGEELLTPTHFMQSTHNTIGSLIAIHTHNHGYNSTYSQKGLSFESALWDAATQLKLGRISSALVGSHDEVTPSYYSLLEKSGYVGNNGQVPCTEASVATVLSDKADGALCEIESVRLVNNPDAACFQEALSGADVVIIGVNGSTANDICYDAVVAIAKSKGLPVATFKNVFGENYSASALGIYALAHCIALRQIPMHMSLTGEPIEEVRRAAFINHSGGENFSIVVMKEC